MTRLAPPDSAIDITTDYDDAGQLRLNVVNSGGASFVAWNIDSIVDAGSDVLPQTADCHKMDLWIAKAMLTDVGGVVTIHDVPGRGPAISVLFVEPAATDQAPQPKAQADIPIAV